MHHHVIVLVALALLPLTACRQSPPQLVDPLENIAADYVERWSVVFPTAAMLAGRSDGAGVLEPLAEDDMDRWLELNLRFREELHRLPESPTLDERIDRLILEMKIAQEFYRWGELQTLQTDPLTYSDHLNHCLTPILVRRSFSPEDRRLQVEARLAAFDNVCSNARTQLRSARPVAVRAAVRDLRATASFVREQLAMLLGISSEAPNDADSRALIASSADELEGLARWLEESPPEPVDDAYGEPRFARELALAYGPEVTPERLEELARNEIETVRARMVGLARTVRPDLQTEPLASDVDRLVRPLLAEMETTNAGSQRAFLSEFLDLIVRSRRFLEGKELVDIPAPETLFTDLSPPHFAGASVGGVYPAGPFDPEAETLFYLPSVPDDAPEEARDGFYRSFNTSFNTTIITHEIYPGHYLQLKTAARHPSRIRPLFAGDDFTEGWASYCEQMTLDAGWDGDRPLTRMAHLRKRLENAVRAYVSVQVHCRGWSEIQVRDFAVDTGLLPPQFAENLWQRVQLSPVQLPSYMIGYLVFDEAEQRQRERLGEGFSIAAFNNAIVGSGGIPMGMLEEYLEATLVRE